MKRPPEKVTRWQDVPFLPIEFFKTHRVYSAPFDPELVFTSSGTSGTTNSRHFVASAALYEASFLRSFRFFYGNPAGYCILALLPSYLERTGSSLVYMAKHLIQSSRYTESGFFLKNKETLHSTLLQLEENKVPTILLGVTYALLDFAEAFPMPLHHTIVMETGGMKGRKKEMVREEVHEILCSRFQIPAVHSEYGMTELLSQAYSKGEGRFFASPWMKVLIRDPYDPVQILPAGKTGGINIIDLANFWSCSFLATGDIGQTNEDGSFEVLGRFDQAEIRGCSLMVL